MEYNYDKIDEYIKGKLTGASLAEFEAQLLKDEDFAEEVALYKSTDSVLSEKFQYEKEDAELAQIFGEFGQKYFHQETNTTTEVLPETTAVQQDNTRVVPIENMQPADTGTQQTSILRWLKPAMGLAIAAAIALLIFQPWQKNLIDTYYEPYALNITERSSGENKLIAGEKAYQTKDYAAALNVFKEHSDDIEVQLAKGNCEFNLGDLDAAVTTFQKIAIGNSVYTTTANWYLALTYLKQEKPAQAKMILQNISKGAYYEKAQALLKDL